jgi:hypothetical protein
MPQPDQILEDELAPLLRQIDEAADQAYRDGFDPDAAPLETFHAELQAAQRRANAAVTPDQRRRAAELIAALCDAYLVATPEQRSAVRQRTHDMLSLHHHLIGFIRFAASKLAPDGDAHDAWLHRGLAAAAIENNVLDFRDTYLALAELYIAAQRAGLDPTGAFRDAGEIADDRPAYPELNQGSMRDFLGNFTRSAFFQADVLPHLDLPRD